MEGVSASGSGVDLRVCDCIGVARAAQA
eukprot:IDg7926t1